MEKCKICGREYKNINQHVNTAHKMSIDDYRLIEETVEVDEVISDEDFGKSVTPEERSKIIFKDEITESKAENPLSELLKEFDVTEVQLRRLLVQYKGGQAIPISQNIDENQRRAQKEASEILENYDGSELEIPDLWTAEELVKIHGFKCLEIRKTPTKRWVLKR